MAKIINCTIGQNQSHYKVYIEWECTQNSSKNQSTVTARLQLQKKTGYSFNTVSPVTVGFAMNGTTYTESKVVNIDDGKSAGTVYTLFSKSLTITHSSDGTQKIKFSCNNTDYGLGSGGYGPGNIKLSETTVELPAIPRAATLDKITNSSGTTITTIAANNSIRVYYSPKSTEFYHKACCYVGSTLVADEPLGKPSEIKQTYKTITVAPTWIPASESEPLTIKLFTFSDNNYTKQVGCQSKSITVTIPDSFKPTPSLTVSLTTGHNLSGAFYLQGISSASITASAIPGTGASLTSLNLTGGGIYESSSGDAITKNTTLDSTGTITYTATATDSRQRSVSTSKDVTVLPYVAPSYKNASVVRCNSSGTPTGDGTYALCKVYCSVQSINVSGEKNPYTVTVKYRGETASSWTTFKTQTNVAPTTTDISLTTTSCQLSLDKTYKFQITITDSVGRSVTSKDLIVRGNQRPINISRNNTGVAIGGLATSDDRSPAVNGLFEVMWPMETHNSVRLLDGATINRGVTINGGCTVASTLTARAANTQEGYTIVTRKTETSEGNSAYSDGIYLLSALTDGTSYKLGLVGKFNRQQIGGSITWHTSDVRLKENISDSKTDALDIVSQMKIRQFDWKGGKHQNIGFIADELEQIDPLLSVGGGYLDDGSMNIKSIDTLYLLGYVTKAVQELAEQNKELREKVQLLESKINLKE